MGLIGKDALLAPVLERVNMPELGGEVMIRVMSGKDRFSLIELANGNATGLAIGARILATTICNENGEPIFTDEEVERLPYHVLLRLSEEAKRVNKLGVDEQEKVIKNSPSNPNSVSG